MKKILLGTVTAGAVALGAFASAWAAPSTSDYAEYRKQILTAASAHMKAVGVMMKSGINEPAQIKSHGEALAGIFAALPTAYAGDKKGSDKSDAKENAWTDKAGFEAAAKKASDAALQLASAAENPAEAAKAAQALGGACKACHDVYKK